MASPVGDSYSCDPGGGIAAGRYHLPSWLRNAAINEWVSIPGTSLQTVEPNPLPGTSGGYPAAKIIAWCGAALKRQGSVYIIGEAGGHADYAGNEIDGIALNTDAPAWAELSPRSADANLLDGSSFNLDGKGAATHNYKYSQFDDANNLFISFRNPGTDFGSATPPYDPPPGWTWSGTKWSPAFSLTDGWMAKDYIPQFPGDGDWTSALCVKHPTTSDVYIAAYGDAWRKYSAATRTWSTLSGNMELNYCAGAIDPARNRMLVVGNFDASVGPRVRALDGTIISVTFGGLGSGPLWLTGNAVVFDERNDQYIVIANTNPVTCYSVRASDFYVSAITTTGTTVSSKNNGLLNSPQYVPELGGIALANVYAENVKFLRLG